MRTITAIVGAALVLAIGGTGPAQASSGGESQRFELTGCDTWPDGEVVCTTAFGVGRIITTPSGQGIVSIPQYYRWTYTVTYPDGHTRYGSGVEHSHELWREGDEGFLVEESIHFVFSNTDTSGITCTLLGHGQIVNDRLVFDRVTETCVS